ncbi:MAG: M23 family peptidase, partial [Mycolicibacter algericus]
MQHGSPLRPIPGGAPRRHRNGTAARSSVPGPTEVTDIIPFNEFGRLDDATFSGNAFDDASEVLLAPELDDLTDTDNMPVLQLAFPRGGYPDEYLYGPRGAADLPVRPARGGRHRSQPTSAVKS